MNLEIPASIEFGAPDGQLDILLVNHPEIVQRLETLAGKACEDMGDALTQRCGRGRREPGRLTPPQP